MHSDSNVFKLQTLPERVTGGESGCGPSNCMHIMSMFTYSKGL